MQTVDKAFKLLNLFSVTQPEIGLSEMARLSGFDKAATRRFLVALLKHNYVEQNAETKKYRLGTGFLRLAKIREQTFPIEAVLQAALERLTQVTHETSHAALISNDYLSTLGVVFPERATRVHLHASEPLPLHATASGLAFLAFAGEESPHTVPAVLKSFTTQTITDHTHLQSDVDKTSARGYSVVCNGYEDDVTGMAVPIFSASGAAMGTLAVATPSSRMNESLASLIRQALFTETVQVTKALGGQIPLYYQRLISPI